MSEGTTIPLVTVVTASFNALDGLRTTVASVAAQVDVAVEHVIIDGGSSDGTRGYLEELGSRVRWLSEPDDGIADAMNKGIAMARGEWILFLHAEDRFMDPGSLKLASTALRADQDILAFPIVMEERDGQLRELRPKGLGLLSRFQMTMPHQGIFCKRALFEKIGKFDSTFRIAMDYDFLLRARNNRASVAISDRAISLMPATGISSRADWPSVAERLQEFRKAQLLNMQGFWARLAIHAYWVAYWPFKYGRTALANWKRG